LYWSISSLCMYFTYAYITIQKKSWTSDDEERTKYIFCQFWSQSFHTHTW
jgi:hypothetical protein